MPVVSCWKDICHVCGDDRDIQERIEFYYDFSEVSYECVVRTETLFVVTSVVQSLGLGFRLLFCLGYSLPKLLGCSLAGAVKNRDR